MSALDLAERATLIRIARAALIDAVAGRPAAPMPDALSDRLSAPGASFVTLHAAAGELRGCIGSIEPRRPLAEDVAANARAAALHDHRFQPLTAGELPGLELGISVLSPLEPLPVTSRAELLALLRPGSDGLLLEAGPHRATFLPAVWSQLPTAERFLEQLELKAGLAVGAFSKETRYARYSVEEIEQRS